MSDLPLHLVFVYDTLQSARRNHWVLLATGARRLGRRAATVASAYALLDLGQYCGLVPAARGNQPIQGEVWMVTAAGLADLDRFERVADGLYTRAPVDLQAPYDNLNAQAYMYTGPV